MDRLITRTIAVLLALLFSRAALRALAAEGEAPLGIQASCTAGEIVLNEIDYDQPGSDTAEFIELAGRPRSDLGMLELHLLASDGTPYSVVPLTGGQTDRAGYYVLAASGVMNEPGKLLSQNNLIRNEPRHGVGLYDTTTRSYCNVINYEGTVTGFEGWLNIGEDRADDGPERSCALSSSGWWACNRPATPGGANGYVAVALGSQSAGSQRPGALLFVFLCAIGATVPVIRRARRSSAV